MHIPDNYLSPASCAVLAVAAAPVIVLSVKKVKVQLKENKELAPMLGIAASLMFLSLVERPLTLSEGPFLPFSSAPMRPLWR